MSLTFCLIKKFLFIQEKIYNIDDILNELYNKNNSFNYESYNKNNLFDYELILTIILDDIMEEYYFRENKNENNIIKSLKNFLEINFKNRLTNFKSELDNIQLKYNVFTSNLERKDYNDDDIVVECERRRTILYRHICIYNNYKYIYNELKKFIIIYDKKSFDLLQIVNINNIDDLYLPKHIISTIGYYLIEHKNLI
jgi:hypothetical protein